MIRYTKQDIIALGLRDPTVRAHIDAYTYGHGITWEDALHSIAFSLVEEKAALRAMLAGYTNKYGVIN